MKIRLYFCWDSCQFKNSHVHLESVHSYIVEIAIKWLNLLSSQSDMAVREDRMKYLMPYIAISSLCLSTSCNKISGLLGLDEGKAGVNAQGLANGASGSFGGKISVSIEDGAEYTNSQSVTLTLAATDASQMFVTNSSDCSSGGSWENVASTKEWTLDQTNSTATVFVQFTDSAGNLSECISDTIVHDDSSPSIISVSPGDSAIEQPIDSNITIRFSEPIDGSSIILATNVGECASSSIEISSNNFQSCFLLDQSFVLSADKTQLTLNPASGLEYGATYKVKIKTSVRDLAGNGFNGEWTSPVGFGVDSWRGSALLGSTQSDKALSLAVDSTGHMIIAGITTGSIDELSNQGEKDIFIARYSPTGEKLWVDNRGISTDDEAYSVSVDGDDNIYVTGYTLGALDGEASFGGKDIFLTKYSKEGGWLFTKILGTNYPDTSYSVAVCSSSLYLAGTSYGTLGSVDADDRFSTFLVKFDLDGNKQWAKDHNSNGSDYAYSVACGDGNVYLTGKTNGSLGASNLGGQDVFVSKYSDSGTREWTSQLGSSFDDEGKSVAISSVGDIYVAGYSSGDFADGGNLGGKDLIIAKLDPDTGAVTWKRQIGTTADEEASAINIDDDGYIYITGFTDGDLESTNAGNSDLIVLKLDSEAGDIVWQEQLGTTQADNGYGISSYSNGIYVTGATGGNLEGLSHAGGAFDAFIVKYSSEGGIQ
jgi:hypothetical protein